MRKIFIISFRIFIIVLILFSGGTIFKYFTFSKDFNYDEKGYNLDFPKNYSIYAVPIPKHVNFAGEAVPIEKYDVFESLDREFLVNTYWQSQTLLFIKRANKFFPIIEPILKKNNIPDDFKYLALAESGLMNVVSPSRAEGYWQFTKATAEQYGLKVDKTIDERYSIEKSTQAACDYLNEAYKLFNSWTLAAASYNVGKGAMNKVLKKQLVSSYYDLYLNSETARYVYRIIAIKYILSDPEKYGFHFRKRDLYKFPEYREVTIDTTINSLEQFSNSLLINYKVFKEMNPWVRSNQILNPDSVEYTFKIPTDREVFKNYFDEADNIKDSL